MKDKALTRAIDAVGGVAALGRQLGITSQAISQWRRAPAERVLAIEKAAAGSITRHDLRPDLYPSEAV